ncbi:ENV1 protein, partial [Rhinopomastus cyanomelas]|nr:ENV1 protein [Rhinopomastus cyanomelas]
FDSEQNTLWKLMLATYQVLNITQPNLTEKCWLCFDIRPPFYEAIGYAERAKRLNGSNPPQCNWGNPKAQGITLFSVTGRGRCVG